MYAGGGAIYFGSVRCSSVSSCGGGVYVTRCRPTAAPSAGRSVLTVKVPSELTCAVAGLAEAFISVLIGAKMRVPPLTGSPWCITLPDTGAILVPQPASGPRSAIAITTALQVNRPRPVLNV